MQFSPEKADAVRRLVSNGLVEAGFRETDLAARVDPWISKSALGRLMNADQEPTSEQARILVFFISRLHRLDFGRVWRALHGPFDTGLGSESEMIFGEFYGQSPEDIQRLDARVSAAEVRSEQLLSFRSRDLPSFTVDPEVSIKVLKSRVGRLAHDPRTTFALLRDIAKRRHEQFMLHGRLGNLQGSLVVLPLSSLLRMLRLKPPFHRCSHDHVACALESLMHDGLSRSVTLAVLNDMVEGPARRWLWAHHDWASISLYPDLLIKRRRGTLAMRVLDPAVSPGCASIIEQQRRNLLQATSLACHGPSRSQTTEFFAKLIALSGRRVTSRFWLN